MNEKNNLKFGIKVDKMFKGSWSFGCCITHDFCGETYLFINFVVWSIAIGLLAELPKGDEA